MGVFVTIIILHYIADFIFQDEEWALNKSKSKKALLKHTLTYSLVWFIGLIIYVAKIGIVGVNFSKIYSFVCITFIFHTVTDYFTSIVVAKKMKDREYGSKIPNLGAFSIIGFDQVLHYLQLIVTWAIIFRN